MRKDPTEFRERFQRWKKGEQVYENGLALPAYEDGKSPRKLEYHPEGDYYYGGKVFPGKELVVTGVNKKPHTHLPSTSPVSKNYQKWDTTDLLQSMITGSDVGDVADISKNLYNKDYASAGIGAAMLAIPNAVEKPIRSVIKPIKRYIQGADIKKKMIDAARSVDFTKHWDDDTSVRWWLNGEKIPDFKFIFHGRGTNRGQAKDVLRTYSNKDVGLHVTENRKTADRFGKNGVVYQGIDATQYPDAIYPDIQNWYASMWESELAPTLKYSKQQLNKEIDQPYMSLAGKRDLEGKLALRDIIDNFGLSYDEIKNHSRRQLFAGKDPIEVEAANKKFAEYLGEHGVNFRYKNDYEGGGYEHPSSFITDPSSVYWSPIIQYKPNIPFLNPNTTIDWINAVKR